jgi:hypothetical protein
MTSNNSYFVSYNQRDRTWAEWIAWTIEDLGYRSHIQAWDFIPGRNWVNEMQTRLADSHAVVCVLSPDFLNSDFAAAEWQAAFASDPIGRERRLIPVRVKECQLEAILQTIVYVDLVGIDRDKARELLRRALIGERAKPKAEPNFPGASSAEPSFPGKPILFTLVLDGTFEEYDKDRVEALTQHLRRILKDSNITIKDVRPGSVMVTVEGNASAFDLLVQLNGKSQLVLLGRSLQAYWKLGDQSLIDPIGQRLAAYEEWLQEFFKSEVDPETAKDLAQDFVLLVLTSDDIRYPVLQSPARAIQIARGMLMDHLKKREEENAARRTITRDSESSDRLEVLKLSLILFEKLSQEEKGLLENYWGARFEGEDILDEATNESREVNEKATQQLREYLVDED